MIKTINSASNLFFKELRQLITSPRQLLEKGLIVAEGAHLAQTLLQETSPRYCIVDDKYLLDRELKDIVSACQSKGSEIIVLKTHLFSKLSSYKNDKGLIILADQPAYKLPSSIKENALLIDRLQDPGNLGTIIRTAAAADIDHIYCSKGTTSPWSHKVLRASVGAGFNIKIYTDVNLSEQIINSSIPVAATSPDSELTIYEADLTQPIAWLVGQEGGGVLSELIELSTIKVSVPHSSKIESLNAAVATAICLFEQKRQMEKI